MEQGKESDIGDFYEQIYKKMENVKIFKWFLQRCLGELNTPKDGIIDRFQVAMYPFP